MSEKMVCIQILVHPHDASRMNMHHGVKKAKCRQLHFTCETPECYPTARPLFCDDTGEGEWKLICIYKYNCRIYIINIFIKIYL